MDILLVIIAVFSAFVGIIGAIAPVIPGPTLSIASLLILKFCDGNDISTTLLVIMVAAAVIVTILDYIAPVWLTKKSGGSKYGTWGATIGLFIGMFAGFLGIILGPFIGAYIGELIAETPSSKAFKVACMSFVAFMLTSGIKLIFSIYILVTVISEGWSILF